MRVVRTRHWAVSPIVLVNLDEGVAVWRQGLPVGVVRGVLECNVHEQVKFVVIDIVDVADRRRDIDILGEFENAVNARRRLVHCLSRHVCADQFVDFGEQLGNDGTLYSMTYGSSISLVYPWQTPYSWPWLRLRVRLAETGVHELRLADGRDQARLVVGFIVVLTLERNLPETSTGNLNGLPAEDVGIRRIQDG